MGSPTGVQIQNFRISDARKRNAVSERVEVIISRDLTICTEEIN